MRNFLLAFALLALLVSCVTVTNSHHNNTVDPPVHEGPTVKDPPPVDHKDGCKLIAPIPMRPIPPVPVPTPAQAEDRRVSDQMMENYIRQLRDYAKYARHMADENRKRQYEACKNIEQK